MQSRSPRKGYKHEATYTGYIENRSIDIQMSKSLTTAKLTTALYLCLLVAAAFSLGIANAHAISVRTWYFDNDAGAGSSSVCGSFGTLWENDPGTGLINMHGNTVYCWATYGAYSVSTTDGGNWIFHLVFTDNDYTSGHSINVAIYLSTTRTTLGTLQGTASWPTTGFSSPYDVTIPVTVTVPAGNYYIQFFWNAQGASGSLNMQDCVVGSTLTIPENFLVLLVLAPLIPLGLYRRSRAKKP